MADKPDTADQKTEEAIGKAAAGAPAGPKVLIKLVVLCVCVMAVAGAAGYLSGGVSLGKAAEPPSSQAAKAPVPTGAAEEYAYFDFEPIVVNLDEPRLARYIRAAITLAIEQGDHKDAVKTIEKSVPEIRSWLTIKLAGCSLENVRGEKNLTRLTREMTDALNARLWPNEKPLIHHVLFKEVAIQ